MRPLLFFLAVVCTSLFGLLHAADKKEGDRELPEIGQQYRALETLARGMFFLQSMYVDPTKVKPDKMVTHALLGVVNKLDPHTVLMPRKAFEQLTIDTQGKFGGVGIIVSHEKGRLIVVSPIEGTPAHEAGVKSGDEIIAIDGHKIGEGDNSGSAAVDRMRGEPGTKLKLTVKRKGAKKPIDFVLVREVIKVRSVRARMLSRGILYARISSFQENTARELEEAVKKNSKKVKGIVLDLRDNPGGLLDQAVRVSDLFIETGLIVSTVGRDPEQIEREFAHKRNTFAEYPMVTMINGGSASASEIVAGALQDHERSLVLGTTSFGKGSVQTLVSLPDGSGLKLTIARYYTPKDRSIQARGIEPDVIVEQRKAKDKDEPKDKKSKKPRKESDLDRHIEAHDLSDLAKNKSTSQEVKAWPKQYQGDHQLVSAYSYLKSYRFFRQKNRRKKVDVPRPKSPSQKP